MNRIDKIFIFILPLLLLPLLTRATSQILGSEKDIAEKFNDTCRILVASGGGSLGSFEAGLISSLVDKMSVNETYDLITGISVGSLNAMILSLSPNLKNGTEQLRKIWWTIKNEDVYNKFPTARSIFDSSPLEKTIRKFLGLSFAKGNATIKTNINITIGATSLNTGELKIFRESSMKTVDHVVSALMSSSAIPLIFPPIYNNNTKHWFVDGGVIGNTLLDFNRCEEIGKKYVIIDVILCSQLLNNVSSKEIENYGPYSLMWRNYDVLMNAISNRPLFTPCPKNSFSKKESKLSSEKESDYHKPTIDLRNIRIRLFQPIYPLNISMLDFTKSQEIWKIGYNDYKMQVYNYCQ